MEKQKAKRSASSRSDKFNRPSYSVINRFKITATGLGLLVVLLPSAGFAQPLDRAKIIAAGEKAIAEAASQSPSPSPGCAVGIALNNESVYEKAFGLAEIEHNVPNTAQTIFESGSVAKQFVGASIVLLAIEGKLKIDDPVRKYIPELPEYGSPLTIRHMLNHTAGLRDWGAVLGVTGVGRGDRVVSQDLAFDVITHQLSTDFKPGDEYSYSNSGYTLLSTIVERVSKQSLPAFTSERFFKPLRMTNTSWRDDYQRLVPGRAQAYAGPRKGPWQLSMPFMNVYGNGGMLTTVGDWLKWNKMLATKSMGAPLVEMLETNGVLNDGRKIPYALGIVVDTYKGKKEISHGGSTAGYRTYLGRFPEMGLSLAVLCNGSSLNPGGLAHDIVNEVAGPFPETQQPKTIDVPAAELEKYAGYWRDEETHLPTLIRVYQEALFVNGRLALQPLPDGSFLGKQVPLHWKFTNDKDGKPVSAVLSVDENVSHLRKEEKWSPTEDDLKSFEGRWYSDEAQAWITFRVEEGKAFLFQRPNTRLNLIPVYKDHFSVGETSGPVVWFTRDSNGKTETMHLGTSRMRDLPFVRH